MIIKDIFPQISIAEPLAANGETVLSPEAWAHVSEFMVEGSPLTSHPEFHRLAACVTEKHTFPVLKAAAMETDFRKSSQFGVEQIDICRRYIASAVFKQISGGTLQYVNEMRNLSVIFINVQGVDVSTASGSVKADALMKGVQRCCNGHEGTLNKFLVDDKGMLFLLCFGLPPLVHKDDAVRAIRCCIDIRRVMRHLDLTARFGVTTSRNYCGVVGSASRMEYTVLGDGVNLSARLMANAKEHGILVGEVTHELAKEEMSFNVLDPIKVKGKTNFIPIFEPMLKPPPELVGIHPTEELICFPWEVASAAFGGLNHMLSLENWRELIIVQRLLKETTRAVPAKQISNRNRLLNKRLEETASVPLAKEATFVERGVSPKSLVEEGGVLILCGGHGLGKVELLEYVAYKAFTKFKVLPVLSISSPRPGESGAVLSDFMRSILSAFRRHDANLGQDLLSDIETLKAVAPSEFSAVTSRVDVLLGWKIGDGGGDDGGLLLESAPLERLQEVVDLIAALTVKLLKKGVPLLACLRFEKGSNIFVEPNQATFWMLAERLLEVSRQSRLSGAALSVALCIRDHHAPDFEHVLKDYQKECTLSHGCWIDTEPFDEAHVSEYIGTELCVARNRIPRSLIEYITNITLGNPLFIREALVQLQRNQHMKTYLSNQTNEREIDAIANLDTTVEVSHWPNTAMVGGILTILESLDPLPASIVKMATVFHGPFTLADLLASACPRWSGAARFEALRLFYALQQLLKLEIVTLHEDPLLRSDNNTDNYYPKTSNDETEDEVLDRALLLGPFKLSSVLVRKVAGAMVLETQRKSVKRQALMDRCLSKELPDRMATRRAKKLVPHIPWYYQVELPQNAKTERAIGK